MPLAVVDRLEVIDIDGEQGRLLVEETPDSYEARIEMPLRVTA